MARIEHERLIFWDGIQVVYFVNSGTEANELAMLMARLYSGNLSMVALRNGYHGGSAGTIGLTGLQTWKYPIPQVRVLLLGDTTSLDFQSNIFFQFNHCT
jgi:4-aminobutyrate aminotransferase-like enzyme